MDIVDLKEFPYELLWPLDVTTQKEDYRRAEWLRENVGEENFFYNHGDDIDVPTLHFKYDNDRLAFRLTFTDLPADPNRDYFDL